MRSHLLSSTLALAVTIGFAPVGVSQDSAAVDSSIRVALVTFGQGDQIWEKFGHNAIWIQDQTSAIDSLYDWGNFDFDAPGFVTNFVRGLNTYSIGGRGPWVIDAYQRFDRSITVQELDLTRDEAVALRDLLEENLRPENAEYRYHYYWDNCSTRLRDALDTVLGGRIQGTVGAEPASASLRFHTRRLSAGTPWLYLGLEAGLGSPIDQPITKWEEMFLPFKVQEYMRDVTVERADGSVRPLVSEERVIFSGTRPDPRETPPAHWILFTSLSVGLAGLVILLSLGAKSNAWARWSWSMMVGTWSLVIGLGGLALVGLWFTDHTTSYWNVNLLHLAPLMFGVTAVTPWLALQRVGALRFALRCAIGTLVLSAVGLILQVTPWFTQYNLDVLLFALPMNIAVAYTLWLMLKIPVDDPPDRQVAEAALAA